MVERGYSVIARFCSLAVVGVIAACGQNAPPAPTAPPEPVAATPAAPSAPLAEAGPRVPVLEQQLAYGEGKGSNLVGFLAMPADAAEPPPGIIVIHEWWGLNDNIKALTRRLAGEGYVALAVDLYGGQVATTPEQAQGFMATVVSEPDATRANLRQAYEYLAKYALAPRIGSIGWGLGGGWSLQTALMFPDDLDAMVMYYGQIATDSAQLQTLKMGVLGVFGERDQSLPVHDVQDFRTTLLGMGKRAEILIYPRVDQAFANPTGGNYDEQAANDAWIKTLTFLSDNLKLRGEASRN